MTGEFTSHGEFVRSYLPDRWPGQLAELFAAPQLALLDDLVQLECLQGRTGVLAHGDFDQTPVFVHNGGFSGIIDLGEARGAEATFGHFFLHLDEITDDETRQSAVFASLKAIYAEVSSAVVSDGEGIWRSAVLLGLRQLSRWLRPAPDRGLSVRDSMVVRRARRIASILASR